jgi:hypothetical protein
VSDISERPLAEALARQILDARSEHGWLAPLAREYLKEIAVAAAPLALPDREPPARS